MADPVLTTGSLQLLGSGIAVPTCPGPDGPKPVITNADVATALAGLAATDRKRRAIERMLADSGCQQRHWSHWIGDTPQAGEETTATLATAAARAALQDAGLTVGDLDMLILAHSTSTLPTIATSTPVAEALGYQGPSLDLKAGCAGTLYALQMASALLSIGYRRILIIAADTMSKYVDTQALLGWPNVGDGAGAVVVGRGREPNFVCGLFGEYSTWQAAGVLDTLPPQAGAGFVMRGSLAAHQELIVSRYADSLRLTATHAGLRLADLAGWIPHQISPALLTAAWKSWDTPDMRMLLNHDRYGNTGAASLLMALHEFRAETGAGWTGLSALGGGMRWGAAVWKDPWQCAN
jgi:3-oxoacyl-[acyl-carrier-protein] synthase-3